MKKFSQLFIFAILLSSTMILASCSDDDDDDARWSMAGMLEQLTSVPATYVGRSTTQASKQSSATVEVTAPYS